MSRREHEEKNSGTTPAEKSRRDISRREFLMDAAVVGAGAVALTGLAQQAPAQAQEAASSSKGTEPQAVKAAPAQTKGDAKKLEEFMKVAREKLYPKCRVCPECDGVACGGEVPGMGGIGTGASFRNNVKALAVYKLKMRTMHSGQTRHLG